MHHTLTDSNNRNLFFFFQFWRLEVCDQVVNKLLSSDVSLLACRGLLSVSSRGLPSECVYVLVSSSFKDILSYKDIYHIRTYKSYGSRIYVSDFISTLILPL